MNYLEREQIKETLKHLSKSREILFYLSKEGLSGVEEEMASISRTIRSLQDKIDLT
jgi:hypothetical protein